MGGIGSLGCWQGFWELGDWDQLNYLLVLSPLCEAKRSLLLCLFALLCFALNTGSDSLIFKCNYLSV